MSDAPKPPQRYPSWSFNLRDVDNTSLRITPPRQSYYPHPRLAPPGMSGIKTSERLGLPATCDVPWQRPKIGMGQEGEASRAFKPVTSTDHTRHKERSR